MKVYLIQVTEEELNSIFALRDGFSYTKESPYTDDLKNVDNLMQRQYPILDLNQLTKTCRDLLDSGQMTRDAFVKILEWKRGINQTHQTTEQSETE